MGRGTPDVLARHFPSVRGTKPFVCHCEPVEGRRGNPNYPKEKYIWAKIRVVHETDKAIMIDNGMKIWIPKWRIHRIRLRNNIFKIYVQSHYP